MESSLLRWKKRVFAWQPVGWRFSWGTRPTLKWCGRCWLHWLNDPESFRKETPVESLNLLKYARSLVICLCSWQGLCLTPPFLRRSCWSLTSKQIVWMWQLRTGSKPVQELGKSRTNKQAKTMALTQSAFVMSGASFADPFSAGKLVGDGSWELNSQPPETSAVYTAGEELRWCPDWLGPNMSQGR